MQTVTWTLLPPAPLGTPWCGTKMTLGHPPLSRPAPCPTQPRGLGGWVWHPSAPTATRTCWWPRRTGWRGWRTHCARQAPGVPAGLPRATRAPAVATVPCGVWGLTYPLCAAACVPLGGTACLAPPRAPCARRVGSGRTPGWGPLRVTGRARPMRAQAVGPGPPLPSAPCASLGSTHPPPVALACRVKRARLGAPWACRRPRARGCAVRCQAPTAALG